MKIIPNYLKTARNDLVHLFVLGCFITLFFPAFTQETVDITRFGAIPDSRKNTTPALKKALEYCINRPGSTLNFPKGRYDFWPISGERGYNAFYINNAKNLTIEGNYSEFIFHEMMEVARANASENLTFRNFSVDWDRPFISQAKIEKYTGNTLDIRIDYEQYPYVVENDTLFFLGEGWKLPIIKSYNNLFDKNTKDIVHNTWDNPLGDIFQQKAEEIEKGLVRLYGELSRYPEKGTYVALYHLRYSHKAFAITGGKNILFQNIKVYHALGMGFIASGTENVTLDHAYVCVNEKKGRVFSTIADASHFGGCKGLITLDGVEHTGQADDFLNIHNGHCRISKIINERTIEIDRGSRRKFGSIFGSGDEAWFIKDSTFQRGATRTVIERRPIMEEGEEVASEITFSSSLPTDLAVGDFIENKTWNPDVIIRNCKVLKKNRARGILITTPGKVIIENNYFNSAGPAIWLESDFNHWFESGAINDMVIRNNVFDNCLTSGNRDGLRYQLGFAVISVAPSVRPRSDTSPPYHRNIHIINNTFKMFDVPILFARAVGGLTFSNNKIIKTDDYPAYTYQKTAWALDGCRNVCIEANEFDERFNKREVSVDHMKESDLFVGPGQGIIVEENNHIFLF